MKRLIRLLIISVSIGFVARADDKESTEDEQFKQRTQRLQKIYQKHAEEYVITINGDDTPLELLPTPVFNWVNRARVGQQSIHQGAVYVWTRQGRAEVVGTIFTVSKEGQSPTFYHELHSLATVPLKASARREIRWNTPDAGIQFASFTDGEAPAETAPRRLVQMKTLARRFSGYSINYDKARWDLSLLPQPLYRIPKSTDESLDQTVFALISTAGTDPEILLVIEARKVDKSFQWQYGVCRFTDLKSYVSLDNQQVWSFDTGTKGAFHESGIDRRYRFLTVDDVTVE